MEDLHNSEHVKQTLVDTNSSVEQMKGVPIRHETTTYLNEPAELPNGISHELTRSFFSRTMGIDTGKYKFRPLSPVACQQGLVRTWEFANWSICGNLLTFIKVKTDPQPKFFGKVATLLRERARRLFH